MIKILQRATSLILILVGIILLGWGVLPSRVQTMEQIISPIEMQLDANGTTAKPTLMEYRRARVEWPASMRIGDDEAIRLVFETVKSEIIVEKPAADLTDVYKDYNLMAEGRLEASGLRVDPANPRRESLPKGQAVTYHWNVNAKTAGKYVGTLWITLRFLPLDGSPPSQTPIYVHDLEIRASSFLGLSGPLARTTGGVGIVGGLGMSFDVMIELIKKNHKGPHKLHAGDY